MPTVIIPSLLRDLAGGEETVSVEARTVEEAMALLIASHPRLRNPLLDESGELRRFVNVYVNRNDIRSLQRMGTTVGGDDVIRILPSIAGG